MTILFKPNGKNIILYFYWTGIKGLQVRVPQKARCGKKGCCKNTCQRVERVLLWRHLQRRDNQNCSFIRSCYRLQSEKCVVMILKDLKQDLELNHKNVGFALCSGNVFKIIKIILKMKPAAR